MARKVRVFVENLSQHVLLKSLDNMIIFKEKEDYQTFINFLKESNEDNKVLIHAYVLMEKYFEFVATPKDENALSKFMQILGRKYVWYFNKKYNRTGTLWEGRYRSSLVEDTTYLFDVMKFIEQTVSTNYTFCSSQKNLFNKKDSVISEHKLYKQLGFTDDERVKKYSQIFNTKIDEKRSEFISYCLEKQHVTGSIEFIKSMEKLVGMSLISKNRGRPKKQVTKKRKKMYKNLVVLDKTQHKDFKITPLEDLEFAIDTTFVPVIANEVPLLGETFPVVFTGGENPSLVSLVSLGGNSLGVNQDGKWITQYIPSYFRRYPFSLGSTKEDINQKVILIDEDSSLFSKSKGKQLFKKNGENSDTLNHAIEFIKSHETQSIITSNVAKAITESGILEDREISVGEGDEKKVLVNGFKVVDKEKLNALSDDILADWVRKGIIKLIDDHLKSLDKIQTLFDLAHQRQS